MEVLLACASLTLALQQLESHIGCTEVATHAHEVGVSCTATIHNLALFALANTGDGDNQSCDRCRGVATHNINAILLTSQTNASVEFVDMLNGETLRDAERHGDLLWLTVHGIHIAEVDHSRLVAQVAKWRVSQVEVNAFEQHIGGDECAQVAVAAVVEHRAIVAHAHLRS